MTNSLNNIDPYQRLNESIDKLNRTLEMILENNKQETAKKVEVSVNVHS
ncbi:hypothetical protein R0K17_09535 [Planococcus sp. SIMBA_143]